MVCEDVAAVSASLFFMVSHIFNGVRACVMHVNCIEHEQVQHKWYRSASWLARVWALQP